WRWSALKCPSRVSWCPKVATSKRRTRTSTAKTTRLLSRIAPRTRPGATHESRPQLQLCQPVAAVEDSAFHVRRAHCAVCHYRLDRPESCHQHDFPESGRGGVVQ